LQTDDPQLQTAELQLQTDDPQLRTPDLQLQTPDLQLRTPDLQLQTPDLQSRTPELQLQTDVGAKHFDETSQNRDPGHADSLRRHLRCVRRPGK